MSFRKLRVMLLRVGFLPIIAVALFVRPPWTLDSTLAFVVEWSGYLLLLAGLGLRMWSILYIGGRKSHELVTDGPYSLCRNPLYVGTFLLTVGAGLCFENIPMVALALLVVVPTHILVVRMEERHLAELFPEDFSRYKQDVPRFWPALRRYRSAPTVAVSVRAIRRVTVDAMAVLLIPEVEDLLELFHEHGILPVLWWFP